MLSCAKFVKRESDLVIWTKSNDKGMPINFWHSCLWGGQGFCIRRFRYFDLNEGPRWPCSGWVLLSFNRRKLWILETNSPQNACKIFSNKTKLKNLKTQSINWPTGKKYI